MYKMVSTYTEICQAPEVRTCKSEVGDCHYTEWLFIRDRIHTYFYRLIVHQSSYDFIDCETTSTYINRNIV